MFFQTHKIWTTCCLTFCSIFAGPSSWNSLYSVNIMSWGLDTVRLDTPDCYIIQLEHTGPIYSLLPRAQAQACTYTPRPHIHTCSHTTDMWGNSKSPYICRLKTKTRSLCAAKWGGVLILTFNRWCLSHFSWKKQNWRTKVHLTVKPQHTALRTFNVHDLCT